MFQLYVSSPSYYLPLPAFTAVSLHSIVSHLEMPYSAADSTCPSKPYSGQVPPKLPWFALSSLVQVMRLPLFSERLQRWACMDILSHSLTRQPPPAQYKTTVSPKVGSRFIRLLVPVPGVVLGPREPTVGLAYIVRVATDREACPRCSQSR